MHQDHSTMPESCAETLEALVRYLARCAAEYDYKTLCQPLAEKEDTHA